jgi:hypothetical protein
MADKAQKGRFNLLGYGAIALYVGLLAVMAVGVFNLTDMMMFLHSNELTREQVRTGHMIIGTGDRTQCRSLHFDNETSELSAETVTDCDAAHAEDHGGAGSYNMFRRSFTGR